jgi:hypothetical protein
MDPTCGFHFWVRFFNIKELSMKFRMVPQAVSISTESQRVWDVITKPEFSQEWRSAIFQTDWSPGSPIDVTATIGTALSRSRICS